MTEGYLYPLDIRSASVEERSSTPGLPRMIVQSWEVERPLRDDDTPHGLRLLSLSGTVTKEFIDKSVSVDNSAQAQLYPFEEQLAILWEMRCTLFLLWQVAWIHCGARIPPTMDG